MSGTTSGPPPRHAVVGRRVTAGTPASCEFTYSVIEAEPKTRGDRRGEGRSRTRLREGQISEQRGRLIVECRIRDLSKRGARLQLDKDRPLPRAFLLKEGETGRAFWATLAWQVGRDAGVKLLVLD